MKRFSKEENSWIFYDWASSAYSIIISTAVFPLFYKAAATNAGISPANSTAYLGYTIAIATFILAMLVRLRIKHQHLPRAIPTGMPRSCLQPGHLASVWIRPLMRT